MIQAKSKQRDNVPRMLFAASLIFLLAFLFADAFAQQMYQYTDKNGNIVFSDHPPVDSGAKEKKLDQDGVYWSNKSEADYQIDKNPRSFESKNEKKSLDYSRVTVLMYSTEWCTYCKQAKRYILSLGANLQEYDIERDGNRRDEMKRKSGGSTGVPLIDIEGTIIRGFNQSMIKTALDRCASR